MLVTGAPHSPTALGYEKYKASRPKALLSRWMMRIIFHSLSYTFIQPVKVDKWFLMSKNPHYMSLLLFNAFFCMLFVNVFIFIMYRVYEINDTKILK